MIATKFTRHAGKAPQGSRCFAHLMVKLPCEVSLRTARGTFPLFSKGGDVLARKVYLNLKSPKDFSSEKGLH